MGLDQSLAFSKDCPLVGPDCLEHFRFPGRAADRYFGSIIYPEAEVDPKVTLRDVKTAAADLVDLLHVRRVDGDPRADFIPSRIGGSTEGLRGIRRSLTTRLI